MNTNVTQVGTTYNFNVTDGDYVFTGTCDKRVDTININGSISYKAVGENDDNMMNNQYAGSFNYAFRETSADFNVNINNKEDADEIFAVLPTVIVSIKNEISSED